MDPYYPDVKQEYPSSVSSASGRTVQPMMDDKPQPMEGLHDAGPPPFLTKIYDMVDDKSIDCIVSWSREGQSFVVWDPHAFSTNLLPRYFKHNNFSSFVRQLNTYGFKKIDPDIWEFANEGFLRGHRHNLKNIKRRKAPSQPLIPLQAISPCVEIGKYGIDGEVKRLRRDKQILMMELVKLRQQQQNTRAHLQAMELRLQGTEKKQQKMMSFLAKAMQNPDFVQKLVLHGKRKDLEETIMNKRKRSIEFGQGSTLIKDEPQEWGDPSGFEMSELDELALEMQGFGRAKRNQEVHNDLDEFECEDRELDEEFWEEFWEELFNEQFGMINESEGTSDDDDEDLKILDKFMLITSFDVSSPLTGHRIMQMFSRNLTLFILEALFWADSSACSDITLRKLYAVLNEIDSLEYNNVDCPEDTILEDSLLQFGSQLTCSS